MLMGYALAGFFILTAYINGRLDQRKAERDGESHLYLFLSFLCVIGGVLFLGGR